jgi:hypothetical protein
MAATEMNVSRSTYSQRAVFCILSLTLSAPEAMPRPSVMQSDTFDGRSVHLHVSGLQRHAGQHA